MTDTIPAIGACLCGRVRITANAMPTELSCCHCSMCRKWAGGPFMAVECGTEVAFEGEENITRYESSGWGERGFCRHCGSHLFYHLKPTGDYHIPAGLFDLDDTVSRRFAHQIFIDEKPDYYAFSNPTVELTGAQVIAQFDAQQEEDQAP